MVGLIHVMLFDMVDAHAGQEGVQELRRRARVPEGKEFRIGEAYDDSEWRRLFEAACEMLGATADDGERVYARNFYEDILKRWPMWFEMSKNSREFLERQPTIHNGFATGVLDSEARERITDKFRLEKGETEIVMHYISENRHCGLYKALAKNIIDHYGDSAAIRETRCMKDGDEECEIRISWH